jgi:Predicted membrane protein
MQKLTQSQVFLRGKVILSPLLPKDEIIIYRMVITCCAADGMPLGIVVKLPGKADFKPEEWVGAEGTIQLLPFNEKLKSIDPVVAMVPPQKIYPYFTATMAYQVQPPKDEYLYP